ncbi:MAG: GNAT family N-acetyltransferase [Ardenticatenaceae bacterium]|nr:GNAT family N-acetyltransferase [Ardenticatenaceae bacterium]
MSDLLVKLYDLPDATAAETALRAASICIRRSLPTESSLISAWVRTHFSDIWAEEVYISALREPSACYIAVLGDPHHVPQHSYDRPSELLIGFACYDNNTKGMFGPMGVLPTYRQQGVGAVLLIRTLAAMRDERYAYAAIGWAGPVAWYERTVGAAVIPNSEPGIYGPLLRASARGDM